MPIPILNYYDHEHLARIALPLGGIGTGTVALGGRGDLRDWEIMNRPAKGFIPGGQHLHGPFFALYARPEGGAAVTRLLEGPLEYFEYEGSSGSGTVNHGLPRFRQCAFATAYPFGQVMLADEDVPIDVRLEAFNPLIPCDADRSGLPVAVLRYVLTSKVDTPVTASVCGTVPNFIGTDGTDGACKENQNKYRAGDGFQGLFMTSRGVDRDAAQWGTMALATTADDVTCRTAWKRVGWGASKLDFWDDFSGDGRLEERDADGEDMPSGSLAAHVEIAPMSSVEVTFILAWHFPNRCTWTPAPQEEGCCDGGACCDDGDRIGNYYTTQFDDAWDVVEQVTPQLTTLEADTARFVETFCASDLPDVVKEAALFNLSTLRSQTCFRTPDGRFYGWEGCHDAVGCCMGSCTHVWNYEQTVAFLFGDLANKMREVEFMHATDDDGLMSFRVSLPLSRARDFRHAAADGQMGCIMKMYRDWQLSGDDDLLKTLWPKVKQTLAFCWIPGGWDADRDGVMEGCQHNTMDVEYYGPNPQMGLWYLGALRAAEEMARHLGEDAFADECRDLYERGRIWIDEHLFNGEYYEHEIRPPKSEDDVAEALRIGMGSGDLANPDYQLGAGCLVDQLVGQYMAHVCGLGYLVDEAHVKQTLRSILKYNHRDDLTGHFNVMRSYALAGEAALLMADYPKERPDNPFPYFTEVMTGFEYTAAIGMLYEGMTDEGLACIQDIRNRYDGRKRNPFDEAECGHHYARAMAAWAAHLSLTGFSYSAVTQTMTFTAQPGRYFWSTGYAWGECRITRLGDHMQADLAVLHGELTLAHLHLSDQHTALDPKLHLRAGDRRTVDIR